MESSTDENPSTVCCGGDDRHLGDDRPRLGAVGDPTGTTYGVSGRNYGSADFGYGLLFESEYTISDGGFTGDAQLDGTGAPVTLTFDGVPEVINGIEFNESYGVWDPGTNGVPLRTTLASA